jgi:hypothetical protein
MYKIIVSIITIYFNIPADKLTSPTISRRFVTDTVVPRERESTNTLKNEN